MECNERRKGFPGAFKLPVVFTFLFRKTNFIFYIN